MPADAGAAMHESRLKKILKKVEKVLMETEKPPILYDVKGNKIPVDGVLLRAQRNTNAETGKFQ